MVMWGTYPLRKIHCIEGIGELCDRDGYPWIAVKKFNISTIKYPYFSLRCFIIVRLASSIGAG